MSELRVVKYEAKQARMTAMAAVSDYFRAVIAERRVQPGDDLISQAVGFEVDGRPVTDDEVTSYCFFSSVTNGHSVS